jgi:DNA sulfur modification protein DndC
MSVSAFADTSLREAVKDLLSEIQELYREDNAPWIVGYSGGKDSTAVLQLIWLAIRELPPEQRTKDVHVISTDTLVENPVVAAWVTHSLLQMDRSARAAGLPVRPNRLTPEVADTFWVNLIGKGYPAPRHKFRWCTERLKIKPSNAFITRIATASGQAILVLGSRKAESTARARNLTKHEKGRVRDRLSPNAGLANTLVYTPIESWTNDDVWLFLMQYENAWGYNNKDLLTMYQGASEDGECPLVVDTSTPSCGDSRFGCWVCTLVDKDKSMSAMIQNDEEKEWMLPLLRLRNELDVTDDRHLRDFRRMSGAVQLFHDRPIPGPYKQEAREHWLRRVLEAQRWIQEHAPQEVRSLELISRAELQEIRRIWVVDKHEIEDSLPRIYQETTGEPFDAPLLDDTLSLGAEEVQLLREIAGDDLQFELIRELLDVERRFQRMTRRAGLFNAIEGALRKSGYDDEQDATARARVRRDALGTKEFVSE